MSDLRRSIGLLEATAYGVGLILGAGIYAILGAAVAETGESVVVAFLLAAFVATLTGLSYAELASRYPEGEAEYLYAWVAFGSKRLSEITALFRIAMGVIASAAVAIAFGGYFAALVPVPVIPVAIGLIVVASAINYWGIEASARVALVFTIIEVSGLLFIVWIGIGSWPTVDPASLAYGPFGLFRATFLVFFAYIGFESLVNVAEETRAPKRTIPRAIGLSIAITTVVYVLVAVAALGVLDWQVLARSGAPLADVASAGWGESAFAVLSGIALFATANTVLIILVSTSRLIYGVSKEEYNSFPSVLARVHPTRQTPAVAVALVGAITIPFVLVGDLGTVAELANLAILIVFAVVNASLLKLRYAGDDSTEGYRAPGNVGRVSLTAVGGLVSTVGLILFYVVQLV